MVGDEKGVTLWRGSALRGGARAFVAFCALLLSSALHGVPETSAPSTPPPPQSSSNEGFHDGIDRSDPDFVKASLLIMSPGTELYSCAGHACIRLECPTFNLDYCFSYESESVKEKVLTFFMGKLKMGMFAVPTEDYLKLGRESGRGVMQYRLNLPPDVKQRLWKLLDDKVAEGPNLPYDYIKRGCAQSALIVLQAALGTNRFEVPSWPDLYQKTRREIVDDAISPKAFPWNRFLLTGLCGTEADKEVDNYKKVVTPATLLPFLQTARVAGTPIVDRPGVELLSARPLTPPPLVTPFAVSWLFVALAILNAFFNWRGIDVLFLAIQSLAGLFYTYLVFVSNLPASNWHWLIVPFNLLPLVFWKWRRAWAVVFTGVLLLWELGMLLYPHRLTDPAYLVLVGAYVVFYFSVARKTSRKTHPSLLERVALTRGRDAPSPACPQG